jgi:LPS sulfotransferase NodH
VPNGPQGAHDYGSFVAAVRLAATTKNGIFGARIMWGSVERLVAGVRRPEHGSDSMTLQAVLGPLRFVHLLREDLVGQAVSWARAEQSGFWQPGDTQTCSPEPDVRRMVDLVHTIRRENASWQAWFARNGIAPHTLTYEDLTSRPGPAVRAIADLVGADIPSEWHPVSPYRKQADRMSAEWSALLRSALHDAGFLQLRRLEN